jgi:PAS domain S-box-containing protein
MLSYDAVENQSTLRQEERAILRANKEWEATFDAFPELLLLTDTEGRVTRTNQAAKAELAAYFGDLAGRRFSEIFPELTNIEANPIEVQLFEGKHWYRVEQSPIKLADGSTYFIHIFQEMTRKKYYELGILQEEQYYEALFQSNPENLAVLDDNGLLRSVNASFENTFGFSNAEARGHTIQALLTARELRVAAKPPADHPGVHEQAGTFRCISKDGRMLMLSIRELPITLNGNERCRLAIFHRVSTPPEAFAGLPADDARRLEHFEHLESRLPSALQAMDELLRSLNNADLTAKQLDLKTRADEHMEQLKVLLADLQNAQKHVVELTAANPRVINEKNPDQYDTRATQPQHDQKKSNDHGRILLVEDNPINQKLMLRLLERRGIQVTVAENGIAALRLLAKQTYDLIFMDIQMPEMDGIETSRRIRVREHDDQHQWIIALTAEGSGGDRMECLHAGMDDYLPKPVDIDRLYALLEKYGLSSQASVVDASDLLPSKSPSAAAETLNVIAALPRFGGEIEVYFDFLNRFIKQLKQTDQKLRSAYKNGDIEQLHAISHGLKGTAANLEALAICDLSNSLEEITSHNTLVGAYTVIDEISRQIPGLEAFYHDQMQERKKKTRSFTLSAETK